TRTDPRVVDNHGYAKAGKIARIGRAVAEYDDGLNARASDGVDFLGAQGPKLTFVAVMGHGRPSSCYRLPAFRRSTSMTSTCHPGGGAAVPMGTCEKFVQQLSSSGCCMRGQ